MVWGCRHDIGDLTHFRRFADVNQTFLAYAVYQTAEINLLRKNNLRERRYGNFSRSISLPAAVNVDKIEAGFDNGVLAIHIPKAEEAKPRRISVQGKKTIEAKAS